MFDLPSINPAENDYKKWTKYPGGSYQIIGIAGNIFTRTGEAPFLANSTYPVKGTHSVDQADFKRDGEDMLIRVNSYCSGTGSGGAGVLRFPMPLGFNIDYARSTTAETAVGQLGYGPTIGYGHYAVVAARLYQLIPLLCLNDIIGFVVSDDLATAWLVAAGVITAGNSFSCFIRVPCLQFRM